MTAAAYRRLRIGDDVLFASGITGTVSSLAPFLVSTEFGLVEVHNLRDLL